MINLNFKKTKGVGMYRLPHGNFLAVVVVEEDGYEATNREIAELQHSVRDLEEKILGINQEKLAAKKRFEESCIPLF